MRKGVLICVLAMFLLPSPVQAAFPGQNGKLAFTRDGNVWTVNPDGSDPTQLTDSGEAVDFAPHWHPDGKKIAFYRQRFVQPYSRAIWVMNADGTDQAPAITCAMIPDCAIGEPTWSPDGSEFAWGFDDHCGSGGVWIANVDGTNADIAACPGDRGYSFAAWSPDDTVIAHTAELGDDQLWLTKPERGAFSSTRLTDGNPAYVEPDWAPTADRLAVSFDNWGFDSLGWRVLLMNRDGTGRSTVRLGGRSPAWSPDGSRIAFVDTAGGEIRTIDPDGSGESIVTLGGEPDWQPIPVNSYVRPKGASTLRIALVTAYFTCGTPNRQPNRTHGPPLAFPSCTPLKESPNLTVGTGDSNGLPARNEGFVRLKTINGSPSTAADEADVTIGFFSDDVLNADALTDYDGTLRTTVSFQITDRDNSPNPDLAAGTTQTIPITFDAGCVPTADPQEGSSCAITTSVEAQVAGAVKEGRRSIWEFEGVEVIDGGPDGDPTTQPGSNRPFARQGVFVP